MTAKDVLAQLKKLGSEQTKKTLMKHGAKEPFFGVKVGDLKVLQKKIKTDHALALELYDSGNSDAMYFAGMIADPAKMTRADLQKWVKGAYWNMLSSYTVPWVASESKFGRELALDWMDNNSEMIANAGWCTYGSLVAVKADSELDLAEVEKLLLRVKNEIGSAPNRVRYSMNNFVIAVGTYIASLTKKAKEVGKAIGTVEVDMGDTSCNVPDACEYIEKVEKLGRVGKKRKHAAC
ncbi:MAG: DNA alkylation repair protein [Planctomycetia bacterium]|nr:DNA alkylation repair protein [Planctomycetia bacterium]